MARTSATALALLLATALISATTPSRAGTIVQLDTATVPTTYPGAEQGQMQNWVQLTWNPATKKLERLSLSAWNPVPSLGLDLQWQPDNPADLHEGPVTGRGTLSFRKPGAPSYDPSATIAQYVGTLLAGKEDGEGEFLDRSGFSYSGGWHDGLMEGQGRLSLADGDEYVGGFAAGKREGAGIFTDATGHSYRGSFSAGLPDPVAILAAEQKSLSVAVVAERRPHNYELGIDPLSYTSKSDGDILDILPDDQRLLNVWHGVVPITMSSTETAAYANIATTGNFLGAYERFEPLSLVFGVENGSTEAVSVVGGYLDVAQSLGDPEPAVQVRPESPDPCNGSINFITSFWIDNFGWAPAQNAKLAFTATSLDGQSQGTPLGVDLGTIADSSRADLGDALRSLGLDTDFVATQKFNCTDPNDQRLCLGELRQSGRFGKLADYLSLDYTTVEVAVAGTLDYDWSKAGGTPVHKSSPFTATLPIGTVAVQGECGEGGEIVPVRHDPFVLHLDDKGYKLALPFTGDVAPGFTSRWRIELSAPQTSEHDFRIVLLLTDGTEIASRPIHLTYFMPPNHEPNLAGG